MDKLAILSRIVNPERVNISKPFLIDVDGEAWTFATDGFGLLAFRGGLTEARISAASPAPESVAGYIRSALKASQVIDLSGLRSFAGAPEYTTIEDCEHCGGTGSKCTCGECECDHCEDGTVSEYPKAREITVCGRRCDANKLAHLLVDVPAGDCRVVLIGGELDPIGLRGDDWVVVLMPVNAKYGSPGPVPAFDEAVAA